MLGLNLITSAIALASMPMWVSAQIQNPQSCVTSYNGNTDYFPVKANHTDTSVFTITYNNNYKTLTDVKNNLTYVLYMCGTPAPVNPNAAAIISIPVTHVGTEDTTSLTFLEMLGVRQTIKYTTDPGFITSPCIRKLNIPQFASTPTDAQMSNVNVTFSWRTPNVNSTKIVRFPATSSTTSLQRYQWIHFLGAFFNKEDRANTVASTIADDYNCIKQKAAAAATSQPATVFANYYSGTWTLGSAYTRAYVSDAGGNAAPSNTTAAQTFDYSTQSAFISLLQNTSDIIYTGDITLDAFYQNLNISSLTAASTNNAYPWKVNGALWNVNRVTNNLATANAWFEQAVAWENVVLADLVKVLHPTALSQYSRVFLRDLDANEEQLKLNPSTDCSTDDLSKVLVAPAVCASQQVAWHGDGTGTGNAALGMPSGRALAITLSAVASAILLLA
ncbi:hypothetical protein SpCBS45565_g01522 [Spizellomyces sp. 'palustris']|nr:hypothetical protein SpCBS45565_g01522 [Spizellomyces sp. 'palustris']